MARPRAFDEAVVLTQAKGLFAFQGYNGTSIDDLVKATGLLRGSIYKAFGSKRNLFELVLKNAAHEFDYSAENLDLLTVALKDLGPIDSQIRSICELIVGEQSEKFAKVLGNNLVGKVKEI